MILASMFRTDICFQFSFLIISLPHFGITVILASWNELQFLLEENVENWHNSFLKCLVKFTSETTWLSTFFFCEVTNWPPCQSFLRSLTLAILSAWNTLSHYNSLFYFLNAYRSLLHFHFLLKSSWYCSALVYWIN